jgi:hypothetical protein
MVDTFTQMIIYLRDGRWFELPEAEFDAIEDLDYYRQRKAKINPYAA